MEAGWVVGHIYVSADSHLTYLEDVYVFQQLLCCPGHGCPRCSFRSLPIP